MRYRSALISLAGAILLLAASAPAAAQDNAIGVKVGVNFANFSLDEDDWSDEFVDFDAPKNKTGLLAGVFISREIRNAFAIQIEGLITQKGAKLTGEDFFEPFEYQATLTYLEIPVLARYAIPFGTGDTELHVYGGPAFSVKLSDKQRIRFPDLDDEWIDLEDDDDSDFRSIDLKGSDVGLALGAAVTFNMFLVDLRYTHGLVNINTDDVIFFDPDDAPAKNRVFSISVGYRFR